MSTSHTPGPWWTETHRLKKATQFESGFEFLLMAQEPTQFSIASIGGPSNIECQEQLRANAALIAAAPELLAALEFILSDKLEVYSPHGANLARAAIAKAKGEL